MFCLNFFSQNQWSVECSICIERPQIPPVGDPSNTSVCAVKQSDSGLLGDAEQPVVVQINPGFAGSITMLGQRRGGSTLTLLHCDLAQYGLVNRTSSCFKLGFPGTKRIVILKGVSSHCDTPVSEPQHKQMTVLV